VAIPDFQTLMLPVLQLTATGEPQIADAVESLADQFALGDEERSALLHSGRYGIHTFESLPLAHERGF